MSDKTVEFSSCLSLRALFGLYKSFAPGSKVVSDANRRICFIAPLLVLFVSRPVGSAADWPAADHIPFRAGEKFQYDIQYQFINAGEASLEVQEGTTMYGRPTYHFISKARSNRFIDAFFKVRDYNSSTVDKASLASFELHQNLREGHYRIMRDYTIDYEKGTFLYKRTYKGKTTYKEGKVDGPASDILSAFFKARTLPLERGRDYEIRVFSEKKTYNLRVHVYKDVKTIEVPAGVFECIRIQPFIIGDAIFKLEGGEMIIWLTNDERKMPVLIRSKVILGAFEAELVDYRFDTRPSDMINE